ncbi:family 16 glycoside hydrolase [Gimesia aquarii]|uniref:Cytochrome c n=1 Tax=Gimesia aquarii TaxID=2527964 RepID=A0A517WRB0_9PLAN|nr:family 16 glycoside hydrolase [Gimesia aquarii]QDU07783.1 Cytochrome c [Gimesia aquarii]
MRKYICILLALLAFTTSTVNAQEFQSLFNGKDLDGWAGKKGFWTVKDGAIVGETTKEKPAKPNTFLVWQGGEVRDFEFKATVRFKGNNSGIQYRSQLVDPVNFALKGYQADLHPKPEYFGMMYGEKTGRGIIAQRFQRVEAGTKGKPTVVAEIGDKKQELVDWEWNEIRIVAVGNRMVHQINGVNTIDLTDDHPQAFSKGVLGLQLHAGPPMRVEFKDLKYRPLVGDEATAVLKAAVENKKKEPASKKTVSKSKKPGRYDWVSKKPAPVWVWRTKNPTGNEPIYLRKKFEVSDPIKAARLYFTCDNRATVWINGKEVGTATDWGNPVILSNAKKFVQTGVNQIAVQAKNNGGVAAFILKLEVETTDEKKQSITSSPDWKLSDSKAKGWKLASFDDSTWKLKLKKMGNFGSRPWGKPGITSRSGRVDLAELTETITVAEDFKVELLYEVPGNEQGSWVSLTTDGKGRLLASDQGDKGLYRITVTKHDEEPQVEVEKLKMDLSGAQGMVWHNDALYFHRNGGNLFKMTDTNGDDQFDKAEVLPSERSGGEHGNHAVIVAEDGEHLYVIGGNHAALPPQDSIVRSHVPTWDEDLLLPREWDANGHARGRLAPGGWISKFSPETKQHEIISTGYRNQYDIALNRFGDLFTYDADMEWDLGTPWYRPTRINCAVSGSDYGWRSGSGKWPEYYEDSLPAVVNIGPGSPTGVISGLGAKFPAKYQDAIFALDWTFGTIYAIHLTPDGAGYRGEQEAFCYGSPLPLTDAIIGHDGALYFTIGGRGTKSALFRITYVGKKSTKPVSGEIAGAKARKLRRSLEAYHGKQSPAAVESAWPHLSSSDRWLRYAARVAIESQPVDQWAKRVFTEKNSQAKISSAVALARMGNKSHRDAQIAALLKLNPAELSETQFLGLLRAYALTFIRLGKPTAAQREQIIATLDPHLPNKNKNINTELVRVLVYLEAPNVISKAIDLIANRGEPKVPDWTELAGRNKNYGGRVLAMLENHPPTHEVNYAFMLRNLRQGWTMDQRRSYIEFINSAAKYHGGNSYAKFLGNLRDEVLGYLSNADRAALADISGENFNPVPDFEITTPQGPGKTWTIAEASKHTNRNKMRSASFESGRNLFHAMRCAACHRFDGLGGDVGPDLTTVKNKFDARYILESIIEPSKVISDQYQSSIVVTEDGRTLTGLVSKDGDKVIVYPADAKAKPIAVSLNKVEEILPSSVSQMPQSMLNALNADEVRDLIAYLLSGGDPKSRVYKK